MGMPEREAKFIRNGWKKKKKKRKTEIRPCTDMYTSPYKANG